MTTIQLNSLSTLREKLKSYTASFHTALENTKLAKSLADGTVTRSDYQRYLQYLAAIHAKLENQIQQFPEWENFSIEISQRVRYPLLQQDLASLGCLESDTLTLPSLEVPWSFATAVGVMYVLEGSTMGGRILTQRLSHIIGKDGVPSTRYFQAYGDLTMSRWSEYCTFLDEFASRDSYAQDKVILAACAMFLLLQRIMNELD